MMRSQRDHSGAIGALIAAVAALAFTSFVAGRPQPERGPAKTSSAETSSHTIQMKQPRAGAILCRLLDVKSVARLHIGLAVFHQAHQADGERLGEMLRSHDGATGKFETPDGDWHSATVLRLGSCFGRGLLVFQAKEASLARKEEIWLSVATRKGPLNHKTP